VVDRVRHLWSFVSSSRECRSLTAGLPTIEYMAVAAQDRLGIAKGDTAVRVQHCMIEVSAVESVSVQLDTTWWWKWNSRTEQRGYQAISN